MTTGDVRPAEWRLLQGEIEGLGPAPGRQGIWCSPSALSRSSREYHRACSPETSQPSNQRYHALEVNIPAARATSASNFW